MTFYQLHSHGDKLVKHVVDTIILAGLPLSLFDNLLDPLLKWSGWTDMYPPLAVIWIVFRITETEKYKQFKSWFKNWLGY